MRVPWKMTKGKSLGEKTYPQCSPHSMVPLEWGAPLLLFPTTAQLCPLQLLLQLGNLVTQRGGEEAGEAKHKCTGSLLPGKAPARGP